MKQSEYIDLVWRLTKWSFYLMPFGLGLVIAINFSIAARSGQPLPWDELWVALGMLVGGCFVFGFCWVIYKAIRHRAAFYEKRK